MRQPVETEGRLLVGSRARLVAPAVQNVPLFLAGRRWRSRPKGERDMAQVLGFGGVFFKAADPDAVRDWYRRVLGFDVQDWGGVTFQPSGRGYQVWSPHAADSKYFEPSPHPFMINLMVDDLEGVLETAKAAGVEPLGREDLDDYGRFAWVLDPAGVKVELWEPAAGPPGG